MDFYSLDFFGIKRNLPIVSLGPRIKIASVNLLGDRELVNTAATKMISHIRKLKFDYLVGPEVTVLPLLHELSNILKHGKYVVCRKGIKGYMVKPVSSDISPPLVLNGTDAQMLRGKRVLIVDDVVSTGKTIKILRDLLSKVDAEVVGAVAIFKQGDKSIEDIANFYYLHDLPVFTLPFKNH